MSRSLVPALLVTLAAFTGCAPSVRMPVLVPAMVDIPSEVQVVAVIDRSAPRNAGQGVLGALEGVLTGEGLMADREGAREAMGGLVSTLQESPRYEVITPAVNPKDVDSGLFDRQWDFRKIKKLCKEHGCDAVIALEAFDSDVNIHSGLLRDLDEYKNSGDTEFTHYAQSDTRVLSAWRMYDARANRTLDQVRDQTVSRRSREQATSIQGAIAKLPQSGQVIRNMGRDAGEMYGRRIAPTWSDVRRTYYTKGDDALQRGKRHVKARDWDGAADAWAPIAESGDHKIRGKALFNLALAAETRGDLGGALDLARRAAVDLGSPRSRRYVGTLEARIEAHRRLQRQLAPPPPEPELAEERGAPNRDGADSDRMQRPGTGGTGGTEGGRMERPR